MDQIVDQCFSNLSTIAALVYVVLCRYSDRDGSVSLGVRKLAAIINKSPTTIFRAFKELEKADLISKAEYRVYQNYKQSVRRVYQNLIQGVPVSGTGVFHSPDQNGLPWNKNYKEYKGVPKTGTPQYKEYCLKKMARVARQ